MHTEHTICTLSLSSYLHCPSYTRFSLVRLDSNLKVRSISIVQLVTLTQNFYGIHFRASKRAIFSLNSVKQQQRYTQSLLPLQSNRYLDFDSTPRFRHIYAMKMIKLYT
jgi:hypothetical protein